MIQKSLGSIQNARSVGLLGLILALAAFAFDLSQPLGIAAGICYVAILALGLLARSPRLILLFSIVGIVLTLIGLWLSPGRAADLQALINRALTLLALATVAGAGWLMIRAQRRFDSRLAQLANVDTLTQLANRRVILEQLDDAYRLAKRYELPLAALVVDIDHFKRVNDGYGHLIGDAVLKAVAQTMNRNMRETDLIGRFGGEEFLIVCRNTCLADAEQLAERLRHEVSATDLAAAEFPEPISISVGLACLASTCPSPRDLLRCADEALYAAKAGGRDQVCVLPCSA